MKKRLLYLALALFGAPLLWGQSTVVCTTGTPGSVVGSCGSPVITSPIPTDPLTFSGEVTFAQSATAGVSLIGQGNVCTIGSGGQASSICLDPDAIVAEGAAADAQEIRILFDNPAGVGDGNLHIAAVPANDPVHLYTIAGMRMLRSTRSVTESSATSFLRIGISSNARAGGTLYYCINASDASDFQERCGSIPFSGVNKAGTETCNFGTATESVSVSAGTLTASWTMSTTPTNACDLQVNAVSSLTQTTLSISYSALTTGENTVTLTDQ